MPPPVPGADRSELLDRLAALGPFFAVHVHDAGSPAAPPWRHCSELVDDPAVLRGRVDGARAHLAAGAGRPVRDVERRVAASVVHLGVTARLLSPSLALATLVGPTAPPLDLDCLWWQDVVGGAFPLSVGSDRLPPVRLGHPADPDRWAGALVEGPLRALVGAAAAFSVSPRLLWGNVASAVSGTVAALVAAAPDHAGPARHLARAVLRQPALRDAGSGMPGGPAFRRRSCCLIYRVAPTPRPALCGDCVLRDRRPGGTARSPADGGPRA